jgi:cellulose synthase/poly-beta-1,6-N-acetylglucosamine synthase-like glycosyltransferase
MEKDLGESVILMEKKRRFNSDYLLFLLPFVLCFLSWLYFPSIADWVIRNVFSYTNNSLTVNLLWIGIVRFLYSWYTLIAIGLAGMWVVAAFISRKNQVKNRQSFYPMVSFVVPAFNQEKNIVTCINSLFRCASKYEGLCEILVVDDGSSDYTYELAWSTINSNHKIFPRIYGKVIRHSTNLGKIDSLRTGINRALGGLIAIVDSDSEWTENTLNGLVDYKITNRKRAVTGYTHPNGQGSEGNLYVTLQRLEYSQGLGVGRCAQGLGDNVIVVSGAIGIYEADLLREVLDERNIRSVTEDLEITLEMHKKGAQIGYFSFVQSATVAPTNLSKLWHQRLRWFTGWIHNTLSIHRDLMSKFSWLTSLLWYCYIFEFAGAIIDLVSLFLFPILFWFAPDPMLFGYNLLVFIPYGLLIGVISQAIALRFVYGKSNHNNLLFYTPLYSFLRIINIFARSKSMIDYLTGNNGKWHKN